MEGYAVVDVETTGFSPRLHHRIVEVGVVLLSEDGEVTGQWATLVNPDRDLGAQSIHGIKSADLLGAPRFADIAPLLVGLLSGRMLVAHNAAFDTMFLAAEFHAAGLDVPVDPSLSLCTMRLARDYLRGTGRSLAACCAAAGVEAGRGHDAMDDAIAAARLLRFYLAQADRPAPWASLARHAAGMPWPKFPDMDVPPRFPAPVPVRRGHRSVEDDAAWLERLVDRLPRVPDPPHADEYLDLLDRALLDRHLSATEKDSLVAVSDLLGLTRDQVFTLHEEYLDGLARIAWADGVVTSEERVDLQQVARLLGLDELVAGRSLAAIAPDCAGPRAPAGADDHKAVFIPHQRDTFALDEGDRVAFTGETMRCREEWTHLLESAGLHAGGVTRSTRLLVAADPDSLSGKARKARDYGIPIVTEQAFLQIFERFVGTGERSHSR